MMNHFSDYSREQEIFKRYEKNPILTPAMWPYSANAVFNPAAIQYNNETLLLVRVEGMDGFSHLTLARSRDGKTDWRIDSKPALMYDPESYPEEIWGIEDPRIVKLEELGEYAITYTAFSSVGPLVSLALTKDFQSFKRAGIITPPEDKDASLFPRKIGGRWAMLHRPMPVNSRGKANIWISFSPDLKHWGDYSVVLEAREGGWWDANKIGLGPQPIETEEGWLIIYHGVRRTTYGSIYRVGLALLDLDDPRKVLHRSREWVFGPKEQYERMGDVRDVTFPCGAVVEKSTNEIRIYYGAADTTVALATANLGNLLAYLKSL